MTTSNLFLATTLMTFACRLHGYELPLKSLPDYDTTESYHPATINENPIVSGQFNLECPVSGSGKHYVGTLDQGHNMNCGTTSNHIPEMEFTFEQQTTDSKVSIRSAKTKLLLREVPEKKTVHADSPLVIRETTFTLEHNNDGTVSFLCPSLLYLTMGNDTRLTLTCDGNSVGHKQKFKLA
jgi:hypothetical protein